MYREAVGGCSRGNLLLFVELAQGIREESPANKRRGKGKRHPEVYTLSDTRTRVLLCHSIVDWNERVAGFSDRAAADCHVSPRYLSGSDKRVPAHGQNLGKRFFRHDGKGREVQCGMGENIVCSDKIRGRASSREGKCVKRKRF